MANMMFSEASAYARWCGEGPDDPPEGDQHEHRCSMCGARWPCDDPDCEAEYSVWCETCIALTGRE